MEDYKKKYEEVLENIKKIKAANKDNKELVDFIEYEYPELKESEEERVRKALLNEFINLQSKGYKFAGLEGEEIISWLEKQGEQKPVPDDELSDFESALFSAFSDAWQEYLRGEEVNVAKWAREHSAELLEIAREQKPAWSEEDEKIMNQIVFNLEKCIVPGFPIYVGGVELGINWLKSLKERYTWKPSKEQMHYLSWIANIKLGDSVVEQEVSKHLNELLEDLKKLREE